MPSINFDANNVDPNQAFEPVPNGDYRAHIVETDIKDTKDGGGKYAQLVWEILDGEYKGRKVWDRLNIVNRNETAQNIAQRSLSAICHATGVLQLHDTNQLLHKPVMIRVVVKQDKGYDPRNDVKKYTAVDGAAAPAAPVSKATVAPPWAKSA